MNALRLMRRSAIYYRRAHLGLFAGTVLAAAILTGALVVGDSVDHTLHTIAQQRLGQTAFAVTSGERLFSSALGEDLRAQNLGTVATVFALPGMVIAQDVQAGTRAQVNRVQAYGVDAAFWQLGEVPGPALGARDAALDQRLAAQLGVEVGDTVALRIAKPDLLSRDAPLSSREEDASARANFVVRAVVSDAAMGRFSLSPSQVPPYNFFVDLAAMQDLAGMGAQANLLLIDAPEIAPVQAALEAAWTPAYAGLTLVQHEGLAAQLESNRIFIDAPTAAAALALPGAEGALSYLVNGLRHGERFTPYSFITASDARTEGLADNELVANAWLAEQLGLAEGDTVRVSYYAVLPSNRFEERARDFTVRRILPMEDFAPERALVPEFPGLSNVESCKDWKIGMPMDEALLEDDANEAYWQAYGETPKALVTLAAGQAMWANRFGELSGVRFPADIGEDAVFAGLAARMSPRDVGLELRPVRAEANASASQAMDLGGLFLGMSFFLLISALVLLGMFYAFGMQQRAAELGLLRAVGFSRGRIALLQLGETLLIAIPGAIAGALAGLGYAWLLMLGLRHVWQDVVGAIPLYFAAHPDSFVIGIVATVLCALLTAALMLRRLLRLDATQLMRADFTQDARVRRRARWPLIAAALCAFATLALVVWGYAAPPADVAGLFFGSGTLALLAGLLFTRYLLARGENTRLVRVPTTLGLARINATRRRGRSLGLVSSLAAGGFMVLAVSSMQNDDAARAQVRSSGTGGFALYAESTVPILDPAELAAAAPGIAVVPLRVNDGDDASCLNLNQAIRPRVVGVDPEQLAQLGAFAGTDAEALWSLLQADAGPGVVPALVGDSDTAMWTLKKSTGPERGATIDYVDDNGRALQLKLVGKLPMRMSVFQGTLLVAADRFTELWPAREGFRAFLIDAPAEIAAESAERLEAQFDRDGLDVTTTVARLKMFHAVESTYLNMFLVLGGLGLLLGACATGVVVLRNLLERRREIALLRALGFSIAAVFRLLASEYALLLLLGAGIGALASVVAMLPWLDASHGGASAFWRLGVFGAVLGSAGVCALLALVVALPRTRFDDLRAE